MRGHLRMLAVVVGLLTGCGEGEGPWEGPGQSGSPDAGGGGTATPTRFLYVCTKNVYCPGAQTQTVGAGAWCERDAEAARTKAAACTGTCSCGNVTCSNSGPC